MFLGKIAFATRRAFRYIFARFISPRSKISPNSQIPVPRSRIPNFARKGCRCNP